MTPAQFRSTYSYQAAIALGPHIVEITEELPSHEQTGLMMQLHRLMVALPAAIAADLVTGAQTRSQPFFELVAAIDLIDRIYPALDTADTRHDVMALGERLHGAAFAELPAGHEPAEPEASSQDQPAAGPGLASSDLPPATSEPAPLAEASAPTPAAPLATEPTTDAVPLADNWTPQLEFVPPLPQSPESVAAARAAETIPLTASDAGAPPAIAPFADGTPEPAPRLQVQVASEQPVASTVPLVKIDPVSALPSTRVAGPTTQGTTVHVQPNSFQ